MLKTIAIIFLSYILSFAAAAAPGEQIPVDETAIQSAVYRPQVDHSEVNCLTEAIYFEARGEPHAGKLAVAHVILNRTKSEKFPDTVCGVVRQKGQFTYDARQKIRDFDLWLKLRTLAENVLSGQGTEDPSKGSLFFGTLTQPFICVKHQKRVIGNHRFC